MPGQDSLRTTPILPSTQAVSASPGVEPSLLARSTHWNWTLFLGYESQGNGEGGMAKKC